MPDYQCEGAKKMKKPKKRKLSTSGEKEVHPRPAKNLRSDTSEPKNIASVESEVDGNKTSFHLQDDPPWRNLQLILSLQNKDISLSMCRKVELAFDYVEKMTIEGAEERNRDSESVSFPRTLIFLNNWVQTEMISSLKGSTAQGTCLDVRCWKVLRFCLEESKQLNMALSFSRHFLRVIQCISSHLWSHLNAELSKEEFEFYNVVLDCISSVFSSHGGISNENLDLWISVINTVLNLIQNIFTFKLEHSKTGTFVLQLSCYVHEPFAKFLRVHPTKKNGFRDFVDKLLEPLMLSWDLLHLHTCKSSPHLILDLLKLIEEVLSHGLFHPMHIEGFFELQNTSSYKTLDGKGVEVQKVVIKSYHRIFFDVLGKTISRKNASSAGGLGMLLRLFISGISKNKGLSVGKDGPSNSISESSSTSSLVSGINYALGLNAETMKLSFDFFVQIMEYFLLEFNTYSQAQLEDGAMLLDAHCKLRSANKLLFELLHARVYVRIEDTSEGACLNFLRLVYDRIMLLSSKIINVLETSFASDNNGVLVLIVKELVHAVHYLLDIDYEAIEDNLERLWGTVISFTTFSYSLVDVPDQDKLTTEIQNLGCKVVHLYSELRQVNTPIFSLCKAARSSVLLPERSIQPYKASFNNSFSLFICCPEFRLSISSAIKSIPEGQASGCIRQLIADFLESLEWIKTTPVLPAETDQIKQDLHKNDFQCYDMQSELLGRSISELYVLILDSLTVTAGNCSLVSISMKDLMARISNILRSLVSEKVNSIDELLSVFMRTILDKGSGSGNRVMSAHWILVFFFRLYLSCRSLQRQSIILLAPDMSKKMSEKMGDSFTAYSGNEWLERADLSEEGYFSWIIKPSSSLVSILDIVSNINLQLASMDCSPLIYVMNTMAVQRLVDLNRQIKSIDYLFWKIENLNQHRIINDTVLSFNSKKYHKWKMIESDLRHEAAALTKFIMGYLSLVAKSQLYIPPSEGASSEDIFSKNTCDIGRWNFGVGSLNEKTLASALWWFLCQNIDVWCTHASKKDLKKFISVLVHSSVPYFSKELNENKMRIKLTATRKVNISLTSLEVLSNSVLYEQRFVHRNMASVLCRTLEKSVASLYSSSDDANLNSPPDWRKILDALEISSTASRDRNGKSLRSLWIKALSHVLILPAEHSKKKLSYFNEVEFSNCQGVLNLLSWMPKGYLSSKSFSRYRTCILNLEWLVVGSLLGLRNKLSSSDCYKLLKLLLTCRRTLKYLLMASFEERKEGCQSSLSCVLSDGPFASIWLMKSLSTVIGFENACLEGFASQVKQLMFSLMDHTSHVFWTLIKDQFKCVIFSLTYADKHCEESSISSIEHQGIDIDECEPLSDPPFNKDAFKSITVIAEALSEHIKMSFDSMNALSSENNVDSAACQELKMISTTTSCFQGFLWGLASALNDMDYEARCQYDLLKNEHMFKIKYCIDRCTYFINNSVHLLVLEGDQLPQCLPETKSLATDAIKESKSLHTIGGSIMNEERIHHSKSMDSWLIGTRGGSSKMSDQIKTDIEALLVKVGTEEGCVKKSLLQAVLRGENPEVAFCLRQLFIASSAILRLNLQINCTKLSWSLIPSLIQISEFLLLEFASVRESQTFSLVCLYGVVKFLEELGKYFPLLNPSFSRNSYVSLIDLHLRAIGKCICLQGKRVSLAIEERESSTKVLGFPVELEPNESHWTCNLDELKSQLSSSFRAFVGKASELHLLSVVQVIERSVVGVQEGCMVNYEVCTRSADGGMVSSNVASGIECLNMVLESSTGRKRLAVVKRHIQSLVSCLINVVVHLQGQNIFCTSDDSSNCCFARPDSGSVILMCVEVLIKICAKYAFFQLEKYHIAQLLRLPAAIFFNSFQLHVSGAPLASSKELPGVSDIGVTESPRRECINAIYQQFILKLYAACCRLLCTVLKHYKSETQCCIALLYDSVSKLLHCLEMDNDLIGKARRHLIRDVQDGVKCATFLRRIYEEIRQHKDVYHTNSFQLLSNYIWVYCGYGPHKIGIKREIDEALRPGIFALLDICSTEDLKYLHTVFGEGPCRSVLKTLLDDYKLNFQYEGKV
ncbi:unnamed protein product [Cuscuta epithymum]|uniref:Nucleolar 27S pre-rRNA processing Urb2/Npa2 C-terminal domain-containing protein n=1 Tax=Cuscuta epithymum TaxID=186058 RepID=A0AAV0G8A2_9ASTE|nr:unnamed protein product [Cuscuta epithymum]